MTVTADATKWPEFLNIQEVADILRISKMTVYRMVHRGDFDYADGDGPVPGVIRAGRGFRIRSAGLDAYLRGSAVDA